MGSVHARKNKRGELVPDVWLLYLDVPPAPGQPRVSRRRKVVTFRGSERAARRKLRELEAEAATGAFSAARLPVRRVFERYLAERVALHRSPTTYAGYRTALLRYARPLHDVPLDRLTRAHLSALEAHLHTTLGLAHTSAGAALSAVKSALDWAEEVELLPRSPAARWRIERAPAPARPTLEVEQARRFVRALDRREGAPWRLHLLLLLFTNLRLSELRGLRWQDVDLAAGTYAVRQQRFRLGDGHGGGVEHVRPRAKSRAGERGGGLPDELLDELRRHRAVQLEARLASGARWQDNDLVVCAADGRPFSVSGLRRALYAVLRTAGLPRVTPHGLRHAWVSLALEAGVPEHEVSQLAGHASPAVTRAVYTHVGQEAGKRAAARLYGLLYDRADGRRPGGPRGGGRQRGVSAGPDSAGPPDGGARSG